MAVRCPKCTNVFTPTPGQPMKCPKCGFSGGGAPKPAAPPPMAPPMSASTSAYAPQSYAQPTYATGPRTRPGAVTAAAVLGFISGGFSLIAGVLFLIAAMAIFALSGAAASTGTGLGGAFGALGAFLGIFLLILACVALLVGILYMIGAAGALKGRRRTLMLVAAFISGSISLINLLSMNFFSLIGLGLDVTIIVLMFQAPVKAWYAANSGPGR